MANKNAKTDHLKKTQFQNLPLGKAQAIRRKGKKANKIKQKQKKEEEKEKRKFADIFNIILETETKDEELKNKIKERYPDLKPNNKNLIAIEHFARMFKKSKEKVAKGENGEITITKIKGINNKDFLNFQEYLRDTIGEKPIDKQENIQKIYNITLSKKDLKKAKDNLIKQLNSNNFDD